MLTLLPPLVLMFFAYRRMPAVPLLILCVGVGILVAALLQDAGVKTIAQSLMGGYASKSGVKQIDALLSRGGISSIMGTLVLLISGVAFGGVLEKMRTLETLIDATLRWAHTTGRLILSVIISCYIILVGTGSQWSPSLFPAVPSPRRSKTGASTCGYCHEPVKTAVRSAVH
jgi:NhaC family Na+:H+ antiporter